MRSDKKGEVQDGGVIYLQPSTLENIDYSLFEWVNDDLNLSCVTNKGFEKVPVKWVTPERSVSSKRVKEFRDSDGALIYPIITIGRMGFEKDKANKGAIYAPLDAKSDYRGGTIKITRKVNQDKTANFANADSLRTSSPRQINFLLPKKNKKVVYEHVYIPIPVYIDVEYQVVIKTQFQTQMNELVSPFVTSTGGLNYFQITRNGHFYEAFIQSSYSSDNNIDSMSDDEREFKTTVQVKVLGYLIGDGSNQAQPFQVTRENPVQVRVMREKSSLDEKPEHYDLLKKYRERGE